MSGSCERQSLFINVRVNRPACGDAETYVFAHKLQRMHEHAYAGINKKCTQAK